MGALEISLLGGFQLRRDGETLPPIPSRTARSLMAYLVLNRDRAHTRGLLIGTFWPDMAESRGRRRLSHALWQIRTTVDDESCLVTPGDSVRFNPDTDFWLDVDEFEWTIEQAAPGTSDNRRTEADLLEHAVRLYRGDLLAGFYEDWLFGDQDRLRQRFLVALDRLADLAMSRGDYDAALELARRTTQHAPLREEAHRKVMRMAVLLGRHGEAIRQFERCRAVLAADLGTDPSTETLDLYEEILQDREAGTARKVASPQSPLFDRDEPTPLIGRERERTTLAALLDGVLDGHGAVVLIEGESGVGKTRMLAEAADDARWRGMTVVWGGSSPSGGLPYGPIAEALGTGLGSLHGKRLAGQLDPIWRDQLAPLVPGLGGTGSGKEIPLGRAEERERMLEAVALAFEGLSRLNPTFVVLEDVHWADDETIAALLHLSARLADHAILLAVSYRHGEARERPEIWDLLRAIDRHAHSERISLAPCSPAQTEELIRRSLGVPEVNAEFSERVHRETGGIPLFVLETLRALAEGDDLGAEAGESGDRGLPITPTVHRLIQTRLEGLPPGIHDTLSMISVHDGRLLLAEIVDAADTGEMEVLAAVDELVGRRLLTERDGGFRVGHELMRRVVYDGLPLSRRLDLHRRVALAIERHRPGDVEVLAHHFATARIPDRAADYLEQAAGHALRVHAYDTAAYHLTRAAGALEEIDAPAERRYSVAALREDILDTLARRDEQGRALEEMERFATEDLRSDVHRRRASWLAHLDRFGEAEEEARTAVALARSSGRGSRVLAALTTRGMIACWAGKAAEGVAYLEEAAGFKSADLRQQADTRNTLGHNLIDLQRFVEAEPQLLAALALYGEVGDARGQADVLGMLATLRMERGEPDAAAGDYQRAIEISHSVGWRSGEAVYHLNLGILEAIRGRMGAARDAFEAASRIYAGMGNQRGRALVLANGAWLRHAYLGEDERARADAEEALSIYRQMDEIRGEAQSLATLGSISARYGQGDLARQQLSDAIALTLKAEDAWLSAQAIRQLADLELTLGNPEEAIPLLEDATGFCEEAGMDDLVVGIQAVHARALLACGDVAAADRMSRAAAGQLRPGIDQGYLVAAARAEVLRARGRDDDADRYLRLAHDGLMETLSGLSPGERETALSAVPQHRWIVEAWEGRRPTVQTARIAARDAPAGRGLADDEMVEVAWTVACPADEAIDDRIERRRHRVLRLCNEAAEQGGAPTVDDLAGALRSSPATVRRDLAALRNEGHRVTTRGHRPATPG